MRGSGGHSFFDAAVSPPSHKSSHNTIEDADLDARITSSSPHDQQDPFRLIGTAKMAETKVRSAVIVSCPHAGRHYPEELVAAGSLGLQALRDLEDFAVDALLDDFCVAMQPIWEECQASGQAARPYFQARSNDIANALLAITDARAERSTQRILKSTYSKLRGQAVKHISESMPRLADLIEKHAS